MSKERPILFSSPMVRAIMAGQKTQTRRVVKLPPSPDHLGQWVATTSGGPGVTYADGSPAPERPAVWHTRTGTSIVCPYDPGDRLWVRETWAVCASSSRAMDTDAPIFKTVVRYAADGKERTLTTDTPRHCGSLRTDGTLAWRPSTHMPRWASRIALEIIGVRVERLQEISEADALAEGVASLLQYGRLKTWFRGELVPGDDTGAHTTSPAQAFAWLWESINGAGSWAANPWVWVVEFTRAAAESSAG